MPLLTYWGESGHLANALPAVWLGLSSYLFVYLFIYLFIVIFSLLASPRDGLASPAGLGGQGARQGEGQQPPQKAVPPPPHPQPPLGECRRSLAFIKA